MPEITTVRLDQINLKDRQRQDYGDLSGLAESITKYGQMMNLLVEPADAQGRYALIAGGRRLAAMAHAGITSVLVRVWDGAPLDELLLQELELEENIQRKDLTWAEKEQAIARMHRIKSASAEQRGEKWDANDTAKLLGMSRRKVYNAVELDSAMKEDPELARADTAFGAMQRLERKKQLRKREEAVQVRTLAEKMGVTKRLPVRCIQADALEAMRLLAPESQDYVISNVPFGVNIEDVFTSDKKIYEDDPDDISELCRQIFHEAYRVLKPDRWFVVFYPTIKLEECRRFLAEAGFKFQKVPAIWDKPNKTVGSVTDYYQQLVISYETFYFARKGDAKFHDKPKPGNVFHYETPPSSRHHPLQMPPELWEEIFRLITIRGESGVEPFSGSGAGGVAALRRDLGYTGFELDPSFVRDANTYIQEELLGVEAEAGALPELIDDEIPF